MKDAQPLQLLSHAKLNLFLHITGRRADGYHELQTLFQLLDFGDTCQFEVRLDGDINLSCNIEELAREDNLAYRAASLLQTTTRTPSGANINIIKQIPTGAGLGGGSSNAAVTLVALNRLWKTGLSRQELADLGLSLGADVPLFVMGHSAWAEGIGEQLTPIELPNAWYVIIKPGCHVSTADIFSSSQLTRDTPAIKVAAFFKQGGRNDCQAVVLEHYPPIKEAFLWLNERKNAQLTGTGACIFAKFDQFEEAKVVYEQAKALWPSFLSKGINKADTFYL